MDNSVRSKAKYFADPQDNFFNLLPLGLTRSSSILRKTLSPLLQKQVLLYYLNLNSQRLISVVTPCMFLSYSIIIPTTAHI